MYERSREAFISTISKSVIINIFNYHLGANLLQINVKNEKFIVYYPSDQTKEIERI